LIRATGVYRAPSNGLLVLMTFGTVTITAAGGTQEQFTIAVDGASPAKTESNHRRERAIGGRSGWAAARRNACL
jgi:hypothetical protein